MNVNVLIDSCGWIQYFGKGSLVDKYAPYIVKADQKNYYTPSIVLYEVYKKIKSESSEEKAMEACAYIISYTTIVPLDEKAGLMAADASLRYDLPMVDAIVKASAEMHKATIVTSDEHFEDLDGIQFIA